MSTHEGTKANALSDHERRELDCWIAMNIEQFDVRDTAYVPAGNMCRLTDPAWKEFKKLHPGYQPSCTGPYPIAPYSFNPVLAINCFQGTEYADGWSFTREDEKWVGFSDGLHIPPCKSFALSLMLALRHEYEYQNLKPPKEESHDDSRI